MASGLPLNSRSIETMRRVGRPEKTGRQSPTSEALGRFAPQERSAVLSSIRATGATAGPPLVRAVRAALVWGDTAKQRLKSTNMLNLLTIYYLQVIRDVRSIKRHF